jgi:dephospho-CoA kinase
LYKFAITSFALLTSALSIMIRSLRYKKSVIISESYRSNILDLKDIFEGNFEDLKDKNQTILVAENDVDYDLLNRDKVINRLYNAIIKSNPDGRFVISVEGKWGSGKTTIINNVKRMLKNNNDLIIIDEFDPWTYGDQENLFSNMFDLIIKKSGFKYSAISTRKIIDSVSQIIFGSNREGFGKILFYNNNDINILKNRINNYLKLCGKKFVFFIDNIDRAEKENVILLFKLVGNVLDFERVTYVLSFDDGRVKQIFEEDLSLDFQYLKKIIQLQIRIPEINRKVLERIYSQCVYNILMAYGENENNLKKYKSIITSMCKNSNDIRDFKRLINSAISISFSGDLYLDKRDLMVMEYIKFFNYKLYMSIYDNRWYYISHDKRNDEETYDISFNIKTFNKNGKDYFDDLFKDEINKRYIDIISEIFPYVSKYKNNTELVYDGMIFSDPDNKDIQLNKRICSAKYFDLYFSNTHNEFVAYGVIVQDFFDFLNLSADLRSREERYLDLIDSLKEFTHIELFERFQLHINNLNEEVSFDLLQIMFENINLIDNSLMFLRLNAQQRVEVIIYELIQQINDNQFQKFINDIKHNYGCLWTIRNILYWFDNDKEGKSIQERKDLLNKTFYEMGESVLENKIDIYDDTYYVKHNINGLAYLYKENRTKIQNYIIQILNEYNIIRFLYDIIGISMGSDYRYYITKENLEIFTTEEHLDTILEKIKLTSTDQQFVLDVYNSFKSGDKNKWGDTGITSVYEKKLKL